MTEALKGIKVVEIGGAVAMPLAGMLMGSWGGRSHSRRDAREWRYAKIYEQASRRLDAVQ